jgi:hypothetical protein
VRSGRSRICLSFLYLLLSLDDLLRHWRKYGKHAEVCFNS